MSVNAVDPRFGAGTASSVGIVVVTFGAHELLEANLATIDLAAADARVVIVDNFHSSLERVAIRAIAEKHGWSFLPMPANLGFGAGMNHGVEYAQKLGCSTFLLLNPDARLDADVIRELARTCAREPMTLLSPRVLRRDGSVWFRGSYLDERTGNMGAIDPANAEGRAVWLTGACLMVHQDLWRALNGFDPDYFLYWEDADLSRRCVELGGQLSVRQDLVAVHDVGGTQGSTGKSTAYYYFNCRNRLLFASKHLSRRLVLRWIVHTPAASKQILFRGGRRQLVKSPAPLWAAIRGSLAGLVVAVLSLLPGRSARLPRRSARAAGQAGPAWHDGPDLVPVGSDRSPPKGKAHRW